MQPLATVATKTLSAARTHSHSVPAALMSTGSPSATSPSGVSEARSGTGSQSLASLYAIPARRNGFQRPWHPSQMLVWSGLCICLLLYLALCLPFVPREDGELFAMIFVYLGIFAAGLPCYIYVVACDPALTRAEAQPHLERAAAAAMAAVEARSGSPMAMARACEKCNLFRDRAPNTATSAGSAWRDSTITVSI